MNRRVAGFTALALAAGAFVALPSMPADAAIEHLSSSASTRTGERHLSHSMSLDVPNGDANPLLVVAVHVVSESASAPASIASVQVNGQPMSFDGSRQTSTGRIVGLYHRAGITNLNGASILATFTAGSGDQRVLESVLTTAFYQGVDQGSPVVSTNSAAGAGDSPAVTITPQLQRSSMLAAFAHANASFSGASSGTATLPRAAISNARQDPAATATSSSTALLGERFQNTRQATSLGWTGLGEGDWAATAMELREAPTTAAADFTSDCSTDSGGPLVDATPTTRRVQGTWGGLTTSFNHTTSQLANALIVLAHLEDTGNPTTITGITYAGQALVRATRIRESGVETAAWILSNPPAGAGSVVVSVDEADVVETVFKVVAFRRVDLTTPVGTFATSSGADARPTVTLDTSRASSTLLTAFTHTSEQFPPFSFSGVTQRLYTFGARGDNLDPSTTSISGGGAYVDASVPREYEVAWSGQLAGPWSALAIEINGSATGDSSDPPLSTAVGMPTGFIHSGDGTEVVAFAWDFDGDGTTDSTEHHPTHVYTRDGVYDVTLTVTTSSGSIAASTRQMVVRADGTRSFNRRYKVYAPDPAANDGFGTSVAIDGNRLLVGAPYNVHNGMSSGTAYFYEWDGTAWVMAQVLQPPTLTDNDSFGMAVGISGNRAVIGAPGTDSPSNSGSAFVYVHDGTSWVLETELRAADRVSNDGYGGGVGIDGIHLVVGAPEDDDNAGNSGSVYSYRFNGSSWVVGPKVYAPDATSGDNFGRGLAVHSARMIVGAPEDDEVVSASGSAYVFERVNGTWIYRSKITAPDPKTSDRFGQGIGVHGDIAVISAAHDDTVAPNGGSVYVWEYRNGVWVHLPPEQFADDASNDANLGFGLGMWGGRIAAGAPKDDDNHLSNSGSVYVMGCGFDDVSYEIGGRIFEDVAADLVPAGQAIGDARNPLRNATLKLYEDGGDGVPSGVDDAPATYAKNVAGNETWWVVPDGTYWLFADSRTVTPSAGFNPGFGPADVWAEQTYGPAGSVTSANGTYSYRTTAGSMYGGQRRDRSDDATTLATAEHVARVIVSGRSVKPLDFGFSFQAVTRTADGDDDPNANVTVQGSLRQFIANANAIPGTQTSTFRLSESDPGFNLDGNGAYTFTPTSPLPTITDAIVLDGSTQPGVFEGIPIEISGQAAGGDAAGIVLGAGSDGSTLTDLSINRFDGDGVIVRSDNNTLQGLAIGMDPTGEIARGNGGSGISLDDGASGNLIGGLDAEDGNQIASNGGDGVTLSADAGTGNSILGNSIFRNGGLGIDLGADGPDPNDAFDSDMGANDRLNAPTIVDLAPQEDGTVIATTSLDLPAGTYRIEFFVNTNVDGSGRGEGEIFVVAQTITHDGSGPLLVPSPAFVADPSIVTSTVTLLEADGSTSSTSEFSNAWKILHAAAPVPVVFFSSASATQISTGDEHSCARISDGSVQCWGANSGGQLGQLGTSDVPLPAPVRALQDVKDLGASSSAFHTCAVRADGSAWCWGAGGDGRLGNGSTFASDVPVLVSGGRSYRSIATGGAHTCALDVDGSVWCWGSNSDGQLGSAGGAATSPRQVDGLAAVVEIDAGDAFTCARLVDGEARCWGDDSDGQLGNGIGATDSSAPVIVDGVSGARTLAVGAAHACAGLANGNLTCWGANDHGQLGDGTTTSRNAAVLIQGAVTAVRLGAGKLATCVTDADGALSCAGDDGAGAASSTFAVMAGPSGARSIDGGAAHACLADASGRVWCWGAGDRGQIGDGGFAGRAAATRITLR